LGCELSDINDNSGTLFSESWQLLICEELFYQQAMIAADEPIDWGKLAVFWFTKSAKQGFWVAQYLLGTLYEDHEKAVYWLRKAMEQDSYEDYFEKILAFNATDRDDAPKFTFEELEHYRLNNQDSI
jgi:TPR repeat protein